MTSKTTVMGRKARETIQVVKYASFDTVQRVPRPLWYLFGFFLPWFIWQITK